MTGRPTKYSQDVADRIVAALKAGNTLRASAKYVGISEDTLLAWRHRFSDFSALIDRAESEAEVRYVAVIAKAAQDGDWRASLAWLERRRHQDWGKIDRLEITLRQQVEKLAADLGLDPEELIAEAERIISAGSHG